MDHRIRLSGTYSTADRARRLERSLRPEESDLIDDRSDTSISIDDRRIEIDIHATDQVALRAAMNTWCSLLAVAEAVDDAAGRRQ